MAKNKKHEWTYDTVIEAVRQEGEEDRENYVPINRNSLKEAAVSEFITSRSDKSGNVDVQAVIKAMKVYHAKNPTKALKRIERMKEKLAAMVKEAEELGIEVDA